MSIISEFYSRVMTDEESKKKLEDILAGVDIQNVSDAQLREIGKLAENLGYAISIEEATEYLRAEDMELDDSDLDSVAGGKGQTYYNDTYICEVGGQAGYDEGNTEFTVHKGY